MSTDGTVLDDIDRPVLRLRRGGGYCLLSYTSSSAATPLLPVIRDDAADDDDLDFGLSSFKFWRGTVGITFILANLEPLAELRRAARRVRMVDCGVRLRRIDLTVRNRVCDVRPKCGSGCTFSYVSD